MPNSRRNSLRSEHGQAAVEFALVVPVLLLLLLGIIQGGIVFHNYLTVTDAARAASRQAIEARINSITKADVQQAAFDAAPDLKHGTGGMTVDTIDPDSPDFSQGGTQVIVTVTYPYTINLLGMVVASGNLTSQMTGRLE